MKVKFSVIANILEEAREVAEEEIKRFTQTEGTLTATGATPYETHYERTVGGQETSRITSWEVFFEYHEYRL